LTSRTTNRPTNRRLSSHDDEAQLQEVEILRSLNPDKFGKPECGIKEEDDDCHESEAEDNGIINITDFYKSPTQYHLVMELAR